MKQIVFSAETYNLVDEVYKYNKTEESNIGLFELLWALLSTTPVKYTKKEIKYLKSLKRSLRDISHYKDKDKDARVLRPGEHILILEDPQYDVISKCLEEAVDSKLNPMFLDDVDSLITLVESAKDYKPPKPALVRDFEDATTSTGTPS